MNHRGPAKMMEQCSENYEYDLSFSSTSDTYSLSNPEQYFTSSELGFKMYK